MVSGGGHPEPIGSWHGNEPRTTSTEQQGVDMMVQLTDGRSVEVDGVTNLDWSSPPFLVLRTEQMVSCLFQADQVRSVTPRPPDPEDSAVIPIESLPWKPGDWCGVNASGEVCFRGDSREIVLGTIARRGQNRPATLAREETATLTRLVPVE